MSWEARESPGFVLGGVITRSALGIRLAVASLAVAALTGALLVAPADTPTVTAQAVPAAPDQVDVAALLRADAAQTANRAARPLVAVPAPPGRAVAKVEKAKKKTRPAARQRAARTQARPQRTRPAVQERRQVARQAPARKTTHRKVVKRSRAHKAPARWTGARAHRGNAVMRFAYAQLGKPYRYGAAGPWAYDCSGLVMRAYGRAGVRMPRVSGAQGSRGYRVSRSQARPGDLVAWGGHVGIYAGRGYVIHSPQPGQRVKKSRLWGNYRIKRVLR